MLFSLLESEDDIVMNSIYKRLSAAVMVAALGVCMVSCNFAKESYDFLVNYDDVTTGDVSSKGVSVHDPSIIASGDTYYLFGSHMTAAKSEDLLNWSMVADGYSKTNPVYGQIYDVSDDAFAWAGSAKSEVTTDDKKTHVWAPSVIYNKAMDKYVMYYCTSSTWNASNLCYGISDTIDGKYEWQGSLICSGFNNQNIDKTDVLDYVDMEYAKKHYVKGGQYNFEDYPNAIDPTVFYDADGRMWMVYGSWSGGIFIIEIDEATGQVIHPAMDEAEGVDAYFGKKLLGGGHVSIEGPWIEYDYTAGYYYLYVSYGGLVSNGGYQIRCYRSTAPDGDYVDMNGEKPGKSAFHENFGLKLSGNYKLPSLSKAYMAPGHNSSFKDADGRTYIAYHTRFNDKGEGHSPRVHQVIYNQEGWPCMLPYQTVGEKVSKTGYEADDYVGRYYYIDLETDISADIKNPKIMYLTKKGDVVTENGTGSYSVADGQCYIHLSLGEEEYSGVLCAMEDEAGTPVMTFSVVGNNTSLWGVKY